MRPTQPSTKALNRDYKPSTMHLSIVTEGEETLLAQQVMSSFPRTRIGVKVPPEADPVKFIDTYRGYAGSFLIRYPLFLPHSAEARSYRSRF